MCLLVLLMWQRCQLRLCARDMLLKRIKHLYKGLSRDLFHKITNTELASEKQGKLCRGKAITMRKVLPREVVFAGTVRVLYWPKRSVFETTSSQDFSNRACIPRQVNTLYQGSPNFLNKGPDCCFSSFRGVVDCGQ